MSFGLVGTVGFAAYITACKPTRPMTAKIKGKEINITEIKKEEYITAPFEEDENWINVIATAYTASADECGNDKGITASGRKVSANRGTIAAPVNVPMYTKLYIPNLNKVFTVEDRGHKNYIRWINGKMRIDVYVSTKEEAKRFGVKEFKAKIVK